jgi:hypothetical protein
MMESYIMGLLDDMPDGLVELIRNAAQNRNLNTDPNARGASGLPSWVGMQQWQPPLALAGPRPMADVAASSVNPTSSLVDLARKSQSGSPLPIFSNDLRGMRSDGPTDPSGAHPPAPIMQNLTGQALPMNGVPENDIAAAAGNPELMRKLINQTFRPGSMEAPAGIGHSPSSNNVVTDNKKQYCIDRCVPLALPTRDYGTSFWRCVLACMSDGNSGFSSWDRHFP